MYHSNVSTSFQIVRPSIYYSNNTENPPPLPTTMPPMGQVIKTTSTFQAGPTNKREFYTQSSTFRPGVGQVVTGSRSSTITTSSTLTSPPTQASIAGNWQSPRYGANTIGSGGLHPVQVGGSPNNVYGISNNNNNNTHQFVQHYGGNNSFLANERSAAAAAAG